MNASAAGQLELLETGTIEINGRMPWSSNATFLATLTDGERTCQAIYKPVRGERPLWDFAPGLHRRELAAYHLSEELGIDLVPPTVIREGPLGEGSLQWFVDVDHRQHFFTIYEERPDLHRALRAVAVFDVLANNTDRKSGHVLVGEDGHVWGIDHGLCFAAEFKLRTVIWEFAGEPLPEHLVAAVARLANEVPAEMTKLLDPDEVEALQTRASALALSARLPTDPTARRYPWPLV